MKVFFAGHLCTHQTCTAEKNPINATSALQCGDCGGDFGDSVFDDSSKVVILRILMNMLILANGDFGESDDPGVSDDYGEFGDSGKYSDSGETGVVLILVNWRFW